MPDAAAASPPMPARDTKIEVFGFDVNEISQIRRIRALIALGYGVHSFTMRRQNMNADFAPDWPNTHLYETQNEALLKRVGVVVGSILKMVRHRTRLRQANLIIARNMDMLAIAVAAKWIAGAKAPIIYECLDIHGSLTGQGTKSKLMRGAERVLLRAVALVAVSSPGFIRNYFEPIQGYRGQFAIWENKIASGAPLPVRPKTRGPVPQGGPLRLGWVGTIRCAATLEILTQLAAQMGTAIDIHIFGVIHHHVLPGFDGKVAACPNITVHGPYTYPDDLPALYSRFDVVWSQDLWQRGENSDWLLPNRIYEASWAGCPSIAVTGTETGRRVVEDGLGWAIGTADAAALQTLLESLSPSEITARGQALLDRPATDFIQSPDDLSTALDPLLSPPPRTA